MTHFRSRKLILLEANIDDMNPEWHEYLMEELLQAGALDVSLLPVLMKKSRPSVILQVLLERSHRERLLTVIFRESTTLGVRSTSVTRFELEREIREVETPFGEVQVKIGKDTKGRILNISPEYESCKELARKKKVPLKEIYAAARAVFS